MVVVDTVALRTVLIFRFDAATESIKDAFNVNLAAKISFFIFYFYFWVLFPRYCVPNSGISVLNS